MAQDLYIRNAKEKSSRFRTILVSILLVVLLASSVVLVIIASRQQTAETALADFQSAMTTKNYTLALDMYRDVQAKAVLPVALDGGENPYAKSLSEMEAFLGDRLSYIEDQLLSGQNLTTDDRDFILGLGELSSLRLSRFAREQSRSYLLGETTLLSLSKTLNQLAGFQNLKDSVLPLANEYESWPQFQPDILIANQMLQNQQWYAAYTSWAKLADQAESGSFFQDFARLKLQDCKTAMYQPLLDSALDVLEQNRSVTAYGQLQALDAVFPGDQSIQTALDMCRDLLPKKMAIFRGAIEHLVIKPLIWDSHTAFDGDAYSTAAADTMLTTLEFERILDQMYANDYILVDQSRLMTEAGETFALELPEGKKPVVLVIEGLNYFATRRETGNCWDLQLDASGDVCGVVPDANGNLTLVRDAEAIGILDRFVEEHPDFSFDGAKGLITLSGYEGVFGVVTDEDQLDDKNRVLQVLGYPLLDPTAADYENNRQQVREVIEQLKRTGWQIGTSTYGMINLQAATLEQVEADWQKWQSQIQPLVGSVQALSFPNGAVIQASDPRRVFLQEQGVRVFSGLGATPYIVRSGDTVYADKVQLGGFSLTHPSLFKLERFFDASLVLDREARSLFSG